MRSDRMDEAGTANATGGTDTSPAGDAAQEQSATGGAEREPGAGAPQGGEGADELAALRDRYLRLAAEYENFRKRTERERAETWVRAQAQLVERLLDPLDDLQRVAHFSTSATTVDALLEGVQMVERKVLRVLESAGLELIEAHGQPFDPSEHEALMTAAAERQEEDETVGEVFQKGYRFKGDLLRPARVQVRKHGG